MSEEIKIYLNFKMQLLILIHSKEFVEMISSVNFFFCHLVETFGLDYLGGQFKIVKCERLTRLIFNYRDFKLSNTIA